MKFLFLTIIRLYQAFAPESIRSKCLYKESCSNYVFRITKDIGFKAGINAFIHRIKNCKPGYYIIEEKGKLLLITINNEVIEEKDIDERIVINQRNTIKS